MNENERHQGTFSKLIAGILILLNEQRKKQEMNYLIKDT